MFVFNENVYGCGDDEMRHGVYSHAPARRGGDDSYVQIGFWHHLPRLWSAYSAIKKR